MGLPGAALEFWNGLLDAPSNEHRDPTRKYESLFGA